MHDHSTYMPQKAKRTIASSGNLPKKRRERSQLSAPTQAAPRKTPRAASGESAPSHNSGLACKCALSYSTYAHPPETIQKTPRAPTAVSAHADSSEKNSENFEKTPRARKTPREGGNMRNSYSTHAYYSYTQKNAESGGQREK